ncbi:hypothetical protein ACFVWR_14185 [Leifsonia sp. NPDC058292]|uniref:hypothetical protein n=1 Tax=Leifsonia sp. NPDC058292 TaxID=3346428 RepID=UPI0036DA6C00
MTAQPTFDAARSAAIKAMLMKTVDDRVPAARTKRVALVVSLVVGAVVVASGGAAWALSGHSLFQPPAPAPTSVSPTPAPTSTPTPTPTPTSTAAPAPNDDPDNPVSRIPVDCETLGVRAVISAILPDAVTHEYMTDVPDPAGIYLPVEAGLRQAGILSCYYSSPSGGLVSVTAAADAQAGSVDVAQRLTAGATAVDAGDAAALSCPSDGQCNVSLVSGSYWLFLSAQAADATAVRDLVTRGSDAFVSSLAQSPDPLPVWPAPASSWDPRADCYTSLRTDSPITDILGSKWITGAYEVDPSGNPIDAALDGTLSCQFRVADALPIEPGIIRTLGVDVTPGGGWGYRQAVARRGTSVTVAGAESATFSCPADNTYCTLDVLTDNAWMRLSGDATVTPDHRDKLIAAAESLIARHQSG